MSLKQLALSEISACGRNWYLTEALCEDGLVIKPTDEMRKKRIYSGNLNDLFLLLTVMVDFEKTQDVVQSACFHFTDIDEHFIFKVCIVFLYILQIIQIQITINMVMDRSNFILDRSGKE